MSEDDKPHAKVSIGHCMLFGASAVESENAELHVHDNVFVPVAPRTVGQWWLLFRLFLRLVKHARQNPADYMMAFSEEDNGILPVRGVVNVAGICLPPASPAPEAP